MDQCIQKGRFAAPGRTGYQNIAMFSDRFTQNFLLLWRHDAGIHVLVEGEYPARPFTHGKNRGRHDWRDLAREAGSVERENDHVRFSLDLNEVRALILDYFARDLWPMVEHPPSGVNVHLVIADRSDSYSPADRVRALRIAASNSQVTVDVLPGGHWLHVDNAAGVLSKLLDYIKAV